jgi:hypothetical protein
MYAVNPIHFCILDLTMHSIWEVQQTELVYGYHNKAHRRVLAATCPAVLYRADTGLPPMLSVSLSVQLGMKITNSILVAYFTLQSDTKAVSWLF